MGLGFDKDRFGTKSATLQHQFSRHLRVQLLSAKVCSFAKCKFEFFSYTKWRPSRLKIVLQSGIWSWPKVWSRSNEFGHFFSISIWSIISFFFFCTSNAQFGCVDKCFTSEKTLNITDIKEVYIFNQKKHTMMGKN